MEDPLSHAFHAVLTPLEETDVTNEYDQWNFIFGPGFMGVAEYDPWYTRSNVFARGPAFIAPRKRPAALTLATEPIMQTSSPAWTP